MTQDPPQYYVSQESLTFLQSQRPTGVDDRQPSGSSHLFAALPPLGPFGELPRCAIPYRPAVTAKRPPDPRAVLHSDGSLFHGDLWRCALSGRRPGSMHGLTIAGGVDAMKTGNPLLKTTPELYGPEYGNHLLDQYKLFVETAEQTSQRRAAANNYLLTVNTFLVTFYGVAAEYIQRSFWQLTVPAAGIFVCLTWYTLIRSYPSASGSPLLTEQSWPHNFDYES